MNHCVCVCVGLGADGAPSCCVLGPLDWVITLCCDSDGNRNDPLVFAAAEPTEPTEPTEP